MQFDLDAQPLYLTNCCSTCVGMAQFNQLYHFWFETWQLFFFLTKGQSQDNGRAFKHKVWMKSSKNPVSASHTDLHWIAAVNWVHNDAEITVIKTMELMVIMIRVLVRSVILVKIMTSYVWVVVFVCAGGQPLLLHSLFCCVFLPLIYFCFLPRLCLCADRLGAGGEGLRGHRSVWIHHWG